MFDPADGLRSHVGGFAWPALASPRGALLLSVLYQLMRTQWWSPAQLLAQQLRQLQQLLRHAHATVPYYRKRSAFRPAGDLTLAGFRELPVLTRRDVQTAGAALLSEAVPPQFGAVHESHTSGSTGEPVKLFATALDRLFWEAITLRDHHWHARDLSGKLASIRVFGDDSGAPPHGTVVQDWSQPTSELYTTGPMVLLSLATDVAVQAQWLRQHEPDYLLTYPTNLRALIEHFAAGGARPRRLREVRTVGETVPPELRSACRQAWGVPLVDVYSSRELGYLALQCPAHARYHVMAETVLVEVMADDGKPCAPGEVGRVVVTPLHNFATPLIRYELGDYAEVAAPCACGRGLPALARILGRSRNLLTLPNGARHWPIVGFQDYRAIADVRQFQLIQHGREDIEVRLVVAQDLTAAQTGDLTAVIQRALGYPFRLRFTCSDTAIARGPGGKYEEFISLLEA